MVQSRLLSRTNADMAAAVASHEPVAPSIRFSIGFILFEIRLRAAQEASSASIHYQSPV